jgi:hypothetical protein
MDWGSERYVRVYTRDTLTWKVIGWEARTTLLMLLRKVDRTGSFDIGADDPFEAVAAVCDLPLELVVQPGLERLLKRSVVTMGDQCLVINNFIEAQEAVASNALRCRLYRERLRDRKLRKLIQDEDNTNRVDDDTGNVATDTDRHSATRRDTPNRTVPSSTEPKEENAKHPTVILENSRKDIFDVWLEDVIIPAYPEHRRGSGLNAARAWLRAHRPDEHLRGVILASVKEWSESAQWQAKEGNFVPGLGAFFENLTWNSHPKKKAKAEARFVG